MDTVFFNFLYGVMWAVIVFLICVIIFAVIHKLTKKTHKESTEDGKYQLDLENGWEYIIKINLYDEYLSEYSTLWPKFTKNVNDALRIASFYDAREIKKELCDDNKWHNYREKDVEILKVPIRKRAEGVLRKLIDEKYGQH
jgi:hypothetical protein